MRARVFWSSVVVGWLLIAVGVVGVARDLPQVPPAAFARWTIGLAVAHDLFLVPAVIVVGALLRAVLPPAARGWVVGFLVVAAIEVAFAWPLVAGWGRVSTNPSIQPRDYGRGLALTVVALAGGFAASAAFVAARRRRLELTEDTTHV